MSTTKQYVISDDFSDLEYQYIDESAYSISNGQITISGTGLQVVSLNIPAARNSVIEVCFEAKQNTANSEGRAAIEAYDSDASLGGGALDYIKPDDQEWRNYTIKIPRPINKHLIAVTFGLWATQVGDITFRNIVVKVHEGNTNNPVTRGCMIRFDGSDWDIYDGYNSRFTNLKVKSLTVNTSEITVNFSDMKTWHRPLAFAELDYDGAGENIIVKSGYAYRDNVKIKLYNLTDGSLVDPTTLNNVAFINLILFAE